MRTDCTDSGEMMKIIIAYASHDGQTKKISEYIAQHLQEKATVALFALSETAQEKSPHASLLQALETADMLLVGSAIRYGKHLPEAVRFISGYRAAFPKRCGFFSVNLTARKANRNTVASNQYLQKFLQKQQWQPDHVGVFAGRLDYARYRFLDKQMIRLIMKITGGPTDLTTNEEYTDWQAVLTFAKQIEKSYF